MKPDYNERSFRHLRAIYEIAHLIPDDGLPQDS